MNMKILQTAINVAKDGDTILVKSGVYQERIVVNKSICIIGNNATIICYDRIVVKFLAVDVVFKGFIIKGNHVENSIGIYCCNVKNCSILNNTITSFDYGICLDRVGNSVIAYNKLIDNYNGLFTRGSSNIIVYSNVLDIDTFTGISLKEVKNTIIILNNITQSDYGISLTDSRNITIFRRNQGWYNSVGYKG